MNNKIPQENLNFFYGFACNYSCDGCSSGSDSVDRVNDPDLDVTLAMIERSAELFQINHMITLIGGEPLLYWDERIMPLARQVRKYFPTAKINVFTNGQLLGKKISRVVDFLIEIGNFDLTITRHVTHLTGERVGQRWHESLDAVAQHPAIVRIHDDHWHVQDHVDNNLHLVNTTDGYWKSFYRHTSDGSIKPWATKDPTGSMMHGCTGSVCSCVFENRLYKCGNLAMLSHNLQSRGQLDDPDWKKYLDYPWIDLLNPDPVAVDRFVASYGRPTTYCDMCSNDPRQKTAWSARTMPMIFTKQRSLELT